MPHHPAKLPEDIRAYAREMRSRMTDAEALLWMLLRDRRIGGVKFRRQHPVGRYILDFYCVEKQLGVELDGGQHGESVKYDKQRDDWPRSQGIRILRFWNNQMLTGTEAVMEVIYQTVVSTETSRTNIEQNTPSPAGGITSDLHGFIVLSRMANSFIRGLG